MERERQRDMANLEVDRFDFLAEEIALIEEENERDLLEPLRIDSLKDIIKTRKGDWRG